MSDVIHDTPTYHGPDRSAKGDDQARAQAIRQIERRRRFWVSTMWLAIGMAALTFLWAVGEYHDAGGWPVHGFSQSSGIHEVWNIWVLYPLGAFALITAGHAWAVFGSKPISEGEIRQEIERQHGSRR
jgi:hypothetical protein